jgi:hypothetical protein
MCLNETYSRVHIGKHFSDAIPTQNGQKRDDALSPLLFNFPLEYPTRRVQENQEGLELNGAHQPLFYPDIVNLLGEAIDTTKKNTGALSDASKEVGLEINTKETRYIFTSRHQSAL